MITAKHMTFGTDGFGMNYLLTAPTDFDPKTEKLPLIVFLHGVGERGDNIEKVKIHGIPKYFGKDENYRGLRVLTLSPQCPMGFVWANLVRELKELILAVAADMNADPDRITITGLSMGGFGTWEMICAYPDLFAAAGPICGGGVPWRLLGLTHFPPIRTFHGDADEAVPLQFNLDMVNGVKKLGGEVELTIYPGVPHNSWTRTYEETDLIEWLAGAVRK